jgi:acyl-CoA synthetase (AMP-forming)/AMP-acid ligase II
MVAGGKLNITENCLDRHLEKLGNTPAIIWESNDPEEHHRVLTYRDLHTKVVQFANVLKTTALKKATAFVSIWAWCPNWLLPCWPVHASAPFILSSLAGLAHKALPTACRMLKQNL